ncbi:AAA family ATPase [Terribacillus sp. DMT04]|uniref:AAA family ATPase n=1 Tax=Terribacillus sp. DMT04 TaxID=2850441 RepID=UPI001C2BE426|nr:AAA family ATPase [Terribacillus sp. DMT04]QXE01481.1 AAA family ATPase [Terribacillus sp. DMT04]
MKISRLIIEGFRGFNKKRDFKFKNSQLILLYGPNGHGKTSFFDAIEWAFTGKLNRYDDPSDERNRTKFVGNTFSQATPFVQITLYSSESNEIIITRRGVLDNSKSDYGRSFIGVEIVNKHCLIGSSAEDYLFEKVVNSEWLDKIDSNNINNIYNLTHYSSQEKMSHFLRGAKEGERYNALSTILGTEQFNVYKTKLKGALDLYKNDIEEIEKESLKVKTRNNSISEEVQELKLRLEKNAYNREKAEALLVRYNELFTEELSLDLDTDTIMKQINNTNSSLFTEENLINHNTRSLKLLYKGLDQYSKVQKKQYDNKTQLNILEKLHNINEKLTDITWLKDNYKVYQDGTMDYHNKVIYKKEIKQKIVSLEGYIKELELFISDIKHTLEKALETRNFNHLRSLIADRITKPSIGVEFQNIIDQLENIVVGINKKDEDIKDAKLVESRDKEWLNTLENMNEKYSVLLRYVLDYVETVDEIKECPVCGSENVSVDFLTNYASKAQMEVNVDIPNALKKYNDAKNRHQEARLELKELHEKFMEKSKEVNHEINKIIRGVDKQKEELVSSFEDLRNVTKTIEYIEENNKKYSSLLMKYSLEGNIEENIKETFEELTTRRLELMKKNNSDSKEEKMTDLIQILKTDIQNNSILIENYQARINEAGFENKSFLSQDISIFLEEMLASYEKKQNQLINKTSLLRDLIKVMDSFKIHKTLEIKVDQLKKGDIMVSKLESDNENIKEKIETLNEAIKNIPTAIEKLNEDSIEDLSSLVQKVYSKLNSHPIFNKLNFKTEKRFGNLKLLLNVLSDNDIEANPSFIYSAAQVNAIALSLFLSMAIVQEWCKLEVIAIDDPIQSMDGLNSLAFIDLLRNLTDQDGYNKQLFISTHDTSFFELMKKKFQSLDTAVIQFNGYSESGPSFLGEYGTKGVNNIELIDYNKGTKIENFNEFILSI